MEEIRPEMMAVHMERLKQMAWVNDNGLELMLSQSDIRARDIDTEHFYSRHLSNRIKR